MSHPIAVILFPGTNCEQEALRACKRSGLTPTLIRWNDPTVDLSTYSAFILPGGFSYEDRGRSGIVASKDPIMKKIQAEVAKGKPLLGICNGAQILVESGLIPNIHLSDLEMALAWNERIKDQKIQGTGYYNDWIYMKADAPAKRSVFNRYAQDIIMHVPVAHGEGRFTTDNPEILKKLIANHQTLFRYCTSEGEFIDEFPTNPNGAIYNLAGVCNEEGNVLALMPHPERTINGQAIFDSLADFLNSGETLSISPSNTTQTTPENIPELTKPDIVLLSRLVITDNEEMTIKTTMQRHGFQDLKLERQLYFGIHLKSETDKTSENLENITKKLIESGEIANLNKEKITAILPHGIFHYNTESHTLKPENVNNFGQTSYITRDKKNYSGRDLMTKIFHYPELTSVQEVEKGVYWNIQLPTQEKVAEFLQTHILHNPHSTHLFHFSN